MRFTIEQRHLTDVTGKPVSEDRALSFHACDANDADDAVRLFVGGHSAEVIGNVLRFPGFQAIATMRSAEGVFTLQVAPASQQMAR
ncbi:MAG TPA: hypothetical protein VGJ82_05385 [Thermoanaerobaculia bacterium]|jgi:hypothetical protein